MNNGQMGQQQPQNTGNNAGKKKLKKWHIVLIIIGALLVIGAAANATKQGGTQSSTTNATSSSQVTKETQSSADNSSKVESKKESKTESQTEKPTESKEKYIENCKEYGYKDIARKPNNYKGKRAKFEGQVVQVQESYGTVVLRVNVTKEENEFAEGGYLYSDTIYVEYKYKDDNEDKILEDDIVTLYGTLNGTKTYTSIVNSDVTVPYLKAEYVEIN